MKEPVRENLETIIGRLRSHAERSPAKAAYTFLRDDGRIDAVTYSQLYDEVRSLAAELLRLAEPGTRALLLYPSGLEFIKVYLACLYAGIVAVPSSMPRKTGPSPRLAAIVQDATPSLVLSTNECIQIVRTACMSDSVAACKFLATDAIAFSLAPAMGVLPQARWDDLAFLQYTSGSTGTPNGVEVTHRNIVSNVQAIEKAFGFMPDSVMVGWLPLFHDMGLIGGVLAPLYVGFSSVLMSPSAFLKNPSSWLEAVSKFRATCIGSPNFGWDYCVDRIAGSKKADFDLSSLTVAFNGSEPVRAKTLERFHEAFKECGMRKEVLFPCYGMAETTLFVSGGPINRAPVVLSISRTSLEGNQIRGSAVDSEDTHQIVSSGTVSLDLSVLVVDPETCLPCSKRRIGEIWISGASVASGYWNNTVATENTFQAYLSESGDGPYLRSGDLGFIQDGELFITGRLKDLIVINGRNIYPQDIEQVIEQSIDFVEPNMCAAFSVEKDNRETLAIVAEANRSLIRAVQAEQQNAGSKDNPALVKNAYLQKLEALAANICTLITDRFDVTVSSIAFVKPGTFPRTSSGKVQRLRCKQRAVAGELDIVYIMPHSIFERRLSREPVAAYQHALFNRRNSRDAKAPQASAVAGPVAAWAQAVASPLPSPALTAQEPANVFASRQRADAMIDWFRDYAERRLNSRLIDERRTVPPYVVLDLGNRGFFGLQAPLSAGGRELTTADLLRVIEQVAGVDLTIALLVGVHNGLGMRPIQRFGNASTVKELLPELATGRRLAGFALTEPCAGSNPVAMKATAVKTDGGWIVNAEKQWIGIGSWAGVLMVFAKGVDAHGRPLGVVALALSEDSLGMTQGPESLTMGMRGIVQNTVYLRNVFAPDSALVGDVGAGMLVAQDAMMFGRLGIGAMSLGAMKRCAQLMARYATRRPISTGLLIDNAVTLATLNALTAAIDATESLVYEVARLVDSGEMVPDEAYIAVKAAAPELLGEAADAMIQLLGGRGYIETNGAAQIFRDARVLRIFEGPTETLHMRLGASVLRQSESIIQFLTSTLEAPEVAQLLMKSLAEVVAVASDKKSPFPDRESSEQWTNFQAGRLATAAILLAAAHKAIGGKGKDSEVQHAIQWAKRRFADLQHTILGSFGNEALALSRDALVGVISRYATSIGDVDQQLAGENHDLDVLIRRRDIKVASGVDGNPADDTLLAAQPPRPVDNTGATNRAACVTSAAMPRQLVLESIFTWLRTEKRRLVSEVDDDVSLASLGMDSLGAITLSLELERHVGVDVTPDIIYECQTIGRLISYVTENFRGIPRVVPDETAGAVFSPADSVA